MEKLTIGVIGVPSVGKSTLINNFIGSNLAKSNTEYITTYKNNPCELLNLYKADNYEFIDLPGIEEDKITKDTSFKFTKKNIDYLDVLIIVCDIHKYYDHENHYSTLIKKIANMDNRLITLVVANKSDTIEYINDKDFLFTNEREEEKFNYIKKKINDNKYNNKINVFPSCLRQANIFIRGRLNELDTNNKVYYKYKNMKDNLLETVGIKSIIEYINNEINNKKEKIIDHHILNTLRDKNDFNFEELNNIVNRLSDKSILKQEIRNNFYHIVNYLKGYNDYIKNEEEFKKLSNNFFNKFKEELDYDNLFKENKENFEAEYKWSEIENNMIFDENIIKSLYDSNRLYLDKFRDFINTLLDINDDYDLVSIVEKVKNSTGNNIEYLYAVFETYSSKNKYFLNILNNLTFGNPTICFLKSKLIKEYGIEDYNYDFKDYDNYKENFNRIKELLKNFRSK